MDTSNNEVRRMDSEAPTIDGEAVHDAAGRANDVYMHGRLWAQSHRLTSERASEIAKRRWDMQRQADAEARMPLDRRITTAIARQVQPDTIAQWILEAAEMARKRNTAMGMVEVIRVALDYLIGAPLKRQITATTTFDDMLRQWANGGISDGNEPYPAGGEYPPPTGGDDGGGDDV